MEDSNGTVTKKAKSLSAVLVFLVIGLILNTLLNYTQTSTIQDTTATRAVVGDEILVNSKKQLDQIEALQKQITILENKIDSLPKN